MTTIVDALVVTLGLDAIGFKKGTEQANKSLKETETQAKKSADGIVKGFQEVGRQVALLFIGFESASGLGRMIAGLNRAGDALGLLAKDIGVSTEDMTIFGNSLKEAGGTADDAAQTFTLMRKSITDWEINRSVSPLLAIMQHLGVVMDRNNLPGTFLKLGAALRALPRPEAFALGQQAGLSQGAINFLLQAPDVIQRQLDRQRQLHLWTVANTEAARRLDEAWDQLKDQAESFGRAVLGTLQPALQGLLNLTLQLGDWKFIIGLGAALAAVVAPLLALFGLPVGVIVAIIASVTALGAAIVAVGDDWRQVGQVVQDAWSLILAVFTGGSDDIQSAGAKLGDDFATAFGDAFKDGIKNALGEFWATSLFGSKGPAVAAWGFAGDAASYLAARARAISGAIWPTRGERNNNPGNLKAVGNQPRDAQGFRIFASREEGVAAANEQLDRYQLRGLNTIAKIVNTYAPASDGNDTGAYMAALSRATGKGVNDPLGQADRQALLAGIFQHESGRGAATGLGAVAPGASRAAYSAPAAPAGRSVTNTTQIDSIVINTQATDAAGIMVDLKSALQRKGLTYQSDTGLF